MDKKESFVFYRSFYESLTKIPDKEQKLLLFEAITEYALNQKLIDLHGYSEVMFPLIKPQLDATSKRYQKCVENGKKGGAPKGNQNARKQSKNNPKQPKNNLNDNYNYNDNVNVVVKEATANNLFMDFWNNYGRKGFIEDTYKYWLSLDVDKELNNAIVKGAKKYSEITETVRMKYPRTFLENQMWKDYQDKSETKPTMSTNEQLLYFYEMGLTKEQLLAKGATVEKLNELGIE
jgi:hypothetical protein